MLLFAAYLHCKRMSWRRDVCVLACVYVLVCFLTVSTRRVTEIKFVRFDECSADSCKTSCTIIDVDLSNLKIVADV